LSSSFGVIAVLLAAIGLYGVLAFSTAQRTREIGIRMAMGAQRSAVVKMVLQDVLWICGVSIAVALPLALVLGRLLQAQLYGVHAGDPVTLLGGTLLIRLGGIARSHDSRPPRRIRRTDAGVAYGVEQKTGCTTDSRPAPAGSRLNICRLPGTASWAELSTAASADGSVVLRWLFGFS